jgi:hypothetical protein
MPPKYISITYSYSKIILPLKKTYRIRNRMNKYVLWRTTMERLGAETQAGVELSHEAGEVIVLEESREQDPDPVEVVVLEGRAPES